MSSGAEVDTLLREMDGVQEVDIDIDEGSATVRYDASKISPAQLRQGMIDNMFNVDAVVELD